MGYASPLKAVTRKLSDDIVITSAPFSLFNRVDVGARMALVRVGNDIIVWSAIPFCNVVEAAISLVRGNNSNSHVTHLVIPDKEHTLGAVSFKKRFPNLKIMAPEVVDLGESTPIDYRVPETAGNKVLSLSNGLLLKYLDIEEDSPLSKLEFVYLSEHSNRELVVFEPKSKFVLQSDLVFNTGGVGPTEQYSSETGYPEGHNPFTGWSGLNYYVNPASWVGRYMMCLFAGKTPSAYRGLQAINSWDFDSMVVSHGNIIETNAKDIFQDLFQVALKNKI